MTDEDFLLEDDIDEEEDLDTATLKAEDVEDVLLYTLDWSVQSLLERIGTTFNINPAFQRRDAWNTLKKSRYIESLMLGLPVPQVVLAEDNHRKGSFIVLDGKQRLVTMKQFAAPSDIFPSFKLRNLEFLSDLNRYNFEKIQNSAEYGDFAENLLAQPVRTIVVRNWRKPAVLYQIFVRLNQGSLSLSPQELRQALFPGKFTSWINSRSADSSLIHRARRIKGEDFRMRDAEMLLRAVAFSERLEDYQGDLRKFLDEMCSKGNASWDENADHYESRAEQVELAISRTLNTFGERDSFLRFADDEYVRRFNVAVFDAMCLVFGSPEISDDSLREKKAEIVEGYKNLCVTNERFQSSLKSTTKTARATSDRVILFGEVVEKVLDVNLSVITRAKRLVAKTNEK
ncbi:DUF262 domain-containing protein [Amycolatopsis orientalis]|uniref:DUF262 domain-containing protein n=1 Tax=Amycolatopsis orientalis TaxID=31958 RepID=UPI000B07E1FA|nr:DUF262 domain-containing protein [Amycolatopsis orientalis]